jgi:TusA-related sulfurtransferase
MTINSDTKIAAIIKFHPSALETIISINPTFEKLRNPFLRKVMAGRTSISTAAKIARCTVEDFYTKLEPLGYIIERKKSTSKSTKNKMPSFISALNKKDIVILDVRPILLSEIDPLTKILNHLERIEPNQVLKIINTFEPTPLIILLQKKGFLSYTDQIDDQTIETYFYKSMNAPSIKDEKVSPSTSSWETIKLKYQNNTTYLDVRELEMPLPMIKILEAVAELTMHNALLVYHKRIPVFLIPELIEQKISYLIKEISSDEVHLLIFKG